MKDLRNRFGQTLEIMTRDAKLKGLQHTEVAIKGLAYEQKDRVTFKCVLVVVYTAEQLNS